MPLLCIADNQAMIRTVTWMRRGAPLWLRSHEELQMARDHIRTRETVTESVVLLTSSLSRHAILLGFAEPG